MNATMSIPILIMFALEILIVIGLPVAAILVLGRRWGLPLKLALAGAVTFVASQLLHIPVNAFVLGRLLRLDMRPPVLQAIALGLSAGVFEEVARYLVLRFWQKDIRTWRQAVTYGLGHGGIEAVLIGLQVVMNVITVITITTMQDPTALALPDAALEEIRAFWELPLYLPLLAAAERVMALVLHVSLSTLVALCFHRRTIWPLFAAILWHTIADATAVYIALTLNEIAAEGALMIITFLSTGILWLTYRALPPQVAASMALNDEADSDRT